MSTFEDKIEADDVMALRLARHLRDIQGEDGYNYVGQESNELMWWVARRFGLRPAMVEHDEVFDCPLVGKHAFAECGHEHAPLEFESGK